MPKISKNASTMISLLFASAFIVFLAFFIIAMPLLFDYAPILKQVYLYFTEKPSPVDGGIVYWIWIYSLMLIAEACSVAVLFLLFRVRHGRVFSEISVSLIRFVSWGCILAAVICIAVQYYFHMAYCIAMIILFLGLCLRVVKNVIEEATAIKTENDFTI